MSLSVKTVMEIYLYTVNNHRKLVITTTDCNMVFKNIKI